MTYEPIPESTERVATSVMDAAFAVHRTLGPGLLESVYEACFCHELATNRISFQSQLALPIVYNEIRLDAGLRLDLLVENCVIVELKAVEKMNPLYEAQLLTYLRLSRKRLGMLFNFNVELLKHGFKRLVN